MGGIRNYQDIIAWQKSMDLAAMVYGTTKLFPKDELYGLTQQMRKAAVSVSSNIAEGWGRGTTGDYLRFLRMARGSLCELETQIHLSQRLGYLTPANAQEPLNGVAECKKVLQGLIGSVERQQAQNHATRNDNHGEW